MFPKRVVLKTELLENCRLCPRNCGVDRMAGERGRCGETGVLRAARAARHDWEEPCISGTRGSGAVFFSGCSLGCVFCQNREISAEGVGRELGVEALQNTLQRLAVSGVHNINLVTGTHFTPLIAEALETKLDIPVIWNSSGYEKPETLRLLEGKIQIYLPDMKYSDAALAQKYSDAPDYFERAAEAIDEMYRQTGPYRMDADGMLQSGVVIRHMILPGAVKNSFGVLEWAAKRFNPGEVLFSLMSQYTPMEGVLFQELRRGITRAEYNFVKSKLCRLGIEDGFVQELSASDAGYIPEFDFRGL